MSKPLQTYYEATKYLGQFVGKDVAFLHETSCMDMEMRLAIAGIRAALLTLDPKEDAEEIEELKQAIKILELFGYALWPRDTVTDMALRHIETSEAEDWEGETANVQDSSKTSDSSE